MVIPWIVGICIILLAIFLLLAKRTSNSFDTFMMQVIKFLMIGAFSSFYIVSILLIIIYLTEHMEISMPFYLISITIIIAAIAIPYKVFAKKRSA